MVKALTNGNLRANLPEEEDSAPLLAAATHVDSVPLVQCGKTILKAICPHCGSEAGATGPGPTFCGCCLAPLHFKE